MIGTLPALTKPTLADRQLHDAEAEAQRLRRRAGAQDAEALLRSLLRHDLAGRIAVVSSFGSESAVVLDMVARIDPATPVLFLDTGKHFPETIAYRDLLIAWLGLENVRSVRPDPRLLAGADPSGQLWREQPDRCCALRKVAPLDEALAGFDAWITGRKRYQGATRERMPRIEAAGGRIKVNPLADWSAAQVQAAFAERRLPPHPLLRQGYLSIGCAPCTAPAEATVGTRSGRWPGRAKTECGIHRARWAASSCAAT